MRDFTRHGLITLCLSLIFIQVLLPAESVVRTASLSDWCRVSLDTTGHPDVICDECCSTGVFHVASPVFPSAMQLEPRETLSSSELPSSSTRYTRPDIRGSPRT